MIDFGNDSLINFGVNFYLMDISDKVVEVCRQEFTDIPMQVFLFILLL